MQITIKLLMMVLLAISAQNAFSTQSQDQSASSEQQTPPDAQGQASRSAVAKSVTGCVVQGDHGYSLKTESETYPLETEKDLSQYVNKRVTVTGILEHQNSPTQSASGNATTVSDIRLRTIVSVVGDCKEPSK
ncbi:MAG TPA: DUF5818 domain-containing protein [Terriglobales bacterium]|jgi:hypothetical protein|nr:DUF5818 domain-containing protein [Terriglobales bacterium]